MGHDLGDALDVLSFLKLGKLNCLQGLESSAERERISASIKIRIGELREDIVDIRSRTQAEMREDAQVRMQKERVENEQYLKRDYPNELIDLYAAGILLFMAEKVGRKYYKAACRYIRKIKRLGHLKKAKEVETTLRDLYPQRKALLEELDNL